MINTVIFDLDGTLLNTLEDLKDSTNFALKQHGYSQKSLSQIRSFVGNGVKKLIERSIPQGYDNPDFEDCLKVFKDHYSQNMYNKTGPYDEILELLGALKKRGIKIAVVSNKFDSAVKELCKKYFPSFIDVAIGESENVRKKPAPDSVFRAMELLGADALHSVYVGDSEVDAQTSKNASLKCVGVTWGFRDKEVLKAEGADYIIDSPMLLIEVIEKL